MSMPCEEMEMRLFYLAATGDLEGTKRMIENGTSINALDYNSRSPLHLAAERGHLDIVEYLTSEGASLDCEDDTGETPLSLALSRGHHHVQLALIKTGAESRHVRRRKMSGGDAHAWITEAFPRAIALAMLEGRKIEPVSKGQVSLFFSDVVGFTEMSSTMQPCKVADMLTRLFNKFDKLATLHGVEKVDTAGDSYIAATNFTHDRSSDHAARLALFAIDAQIAAEETLVDQDDDSQGHVQLRIGMHCGAVTGSVIGLQNLKYTLLGDAVNTAARMESTSEPGRIQCSEATAALLTEQAKDHLVLTRREGGVYVKGKGHMQTFWVMSTVSRQPIGRRQVVADTPAEADTQVVADTPAEAASVRHSRDVSGGRGGGGGGGEGGGGSEPSRLYSVLVSRPVTVDVGTAAGHLPSASSAGARRCRAGDDRRLRWQHLAFNHHVQ